jgi:hypothetical protein
MDIIVFSNLKFELMYYGFTLIELALLILSIVFLIVFLIAFVDNDQLNKSILKINHSNKYNSIISNREAFKAGFKFLKVLLIIGLVVFVSIIISVKYFK